MALQLSPSFALSDDHPACTYGAPVLLLLAGTAEPRAFHPPDLVPFGFELQSAAHWVARLGALQRKAKDRTFCERFLQSWSSGPQSLQAFPGNAPASA